MQPKPSQEAVYRIQPRRRLFATRKRRAASVFSLALIVVLIAGGAYGWQLISAVMHLEQASVVPLPPSTIQTLPVDERADNVQSSAGLVGDSQTDFGVPDVASPEETADTGSAAVTESRSSEENAAGHEEDLSRLEVARALVEASMASGDPGLSTIWEDRDSLLIMVLGVDRREDGGDQNADVIILARLDLVNKTLTGVSFPRDLLVEIPGAGSAKINGSYNAGVLEDPDDPAAGVAKVRDTLETMLGLRIDGYVLIDFSGFESIVDALGGIDVVVPYEITDTEYPTTDYGVQTIHFDAGRQHMDGDQALKYVRTRHADSDDARRQRQIDVIVAILKQGRSLSSIARADDLIVSASDALQTSFGLEEQLTLARLAMEMSPDQVSIVTMAEPLLEAGWSEDGAWVYTADPAEVTSFVREALFPES